MYFAKHYEEFYHPVAYVTFNLILIDKNLDVSSVENKKKCFEP